MNILSRTEETRVHSNFTVLQLFIGLFAFDSVTFFTLLSIENKVSFTVFKHPEIERRKWILDSLSCSVEVLEPTHIVLS